MQAMILAAGLGTRLGALSEQMPKALAEIAGVSLLEHTILRLKSQGFTKFIINVHHFAGQIINFLESHNYFHTDITISHETALLNTGGALKRAQPFFCSGEPVLIHNVDAVTDLPYKELLDYHTTRDALATLAVRDRDTNRHLLFDSQNQLCGWRAKKPFEKKIVKGNGGELIPLSFMGIYVISPRFMERFPEEDIFSVIDMFLRLAGEDFLIAGYRGDKHRWIDVGTVKKLKKAEESFGAGFFMSGIGNI